MRTTRNIILAVAALAIVLLALRLTVFAPQQNDQQLIAKALQDSIQASREGRPGGVLDLLSDKFQINSQSPRTFDIAKFIRENKPEVEVYNTNAIISGDTARIDTPVHVKFHILTQDIDQKVDNVTLIFQKEDGHKFLIIPDKEWHLVDVQVPANIPIDVGGDSGFGGLF